MGRARTDEGNEGTRSTSAIPASMSYVASLRRVAAYTRGPAATTNHGSRRTVMSDVPTEKASGLLDPRINGRFRNDGQLSIKRGDDRRGSSREVLTDRDQPEYKTPTAQTRRNRRSASGGTVGHLHRNTQNGPRAKIACLDAL